MFGTRRPLFAIKASVCVAIETQQVPLEAVLAILRLARACRKLLQSIFSIDASYC